MAWPDTLRAPRAVLAALALALSSPVPAAMHEPHRVVTLAPHATELVYAAGGGDLLVGTVSSSDYPPPARELPRVGDGMLLNQERLVLLKPTLILAWQRFGAAMPAEALAPALDAQMAYSAPASLRDIPAEVRRLGGLLGRAEPAEKAAAAMDVRIADLEAHYSKRELITVFVEVGSLPLYTIGDDPLLNDAMRICGAINIYGSAPVAAPKVPIESVLVHDPQLIVVPAQTGTRSEAVRTHWAEYGLQAAIAGRVHEADPDALFRPGPRFIDATEALCAAVHDVREAIRF